MAYMERVGEDTRSHQDRTVDLIPSRGRGCDRGTPTSSVRSAPRLVTPGISKSAGLT